MGDTQGGAGDLQLSLLFVRCEWNLGPLNDGRCPAAPVSHSSARGPGALTHGEPHILSWSLTPAPLPSALWLVGDHLKWVCSALSGSFTVRSQPEWDPAADNTATTSSAHHRTNPPFDFSMTTPCVGGFQAQSRASRGQPHPCPCAGLSRQHAQQGGRGQCAHVTPFQGADFLQNERPFSNC